MTLNMMTDEQYKELLIILAEECAEVVQECSKILRFDNDTVNLEKEIGDVVALLLIASMHDEIDLNKVAKRVPEKVKKLKKFSSLFE